MKPKDVKRLLFSEIEATSENYADYVNNAKTDFKRNRKLSFSTIIKAIIGMENKSLTNELIDIFPDVDTLPSASAFVQQRQKEFFELYFRIVRFKVNENLYETVLTNLNKNNYTPEKLKELYNSRWGIETSFRDLKYTIEMLAFHSKKVMCIHQEIYAHLIMYNFAEMITSHVIIEKNKENIHTRQTFQSHFMCVDSFLEEKQHHLI